MSIMLSVVLKFFLIINEVNFNSTNSRALLGLCVPLCIHTVICSMRTALVASVSCSRLFMCSILRVAVFSF